MLTLSAAMSQSAYPGRGIIVGASADGQNAVCAYFIMGRSVNSRNRVFVPEGEGVRTQAHDPSKMSDPTLIIYAPVRVWREHLILTNGDQTDTIRDFLARGDTFEDALRTRAFEPDAPNYTPRVSALVTLSGNGFSYKLAILKSADGNPACCRRYFFEYETPLPGIGHFLHTYAGDGDPLPSFAGEPEAVALGNGIDDIAGTIWESLNDDNKVSLFVRTVNLRTGASESRILNKHH